MADNGKKWIYSTMKTADAYGNIRVGIIKQAIDDYKRALCKGDKYKIEALEHWFLSEWGEMLSGYNGSYIIEKIRKEMKK